jgi:hypothetical protein
VFATLEAKILGSIALVAVLLGAFGVYTYRERNIGKETELTALKVSSDKLAADLRARATTAEQAYDKEVAASANLPPVQPVRLCVNANSRPAKGAKQPGNAASAAAGNIQPVPAGNTSVPGPDIGPLLDLFAKRADQINAELREYQRRGE